MQFSDKLKKLMRKPFRSQQTLADEVGVSQNLVSHWVRGKALPDMYEARRLAEVLGVDLNYLADDRLDEPPRDKPGALPPGVQSVVDLFLALELSPAEALRRLANQYPRPATDETSGDGDRGRRRQG